MKHQAIIKALTACCLWGAAALPTWAGNYVVNSFDVPGSTYTDIWDINNAGVFVGTAYDTSSSYGYVYDAGTITRLTGPVGSFSANALGISEVGKVVVGSFDANGLGDGSGLHGFIYQNGSYTQVDVPTFMGSQTVLRSISPDGRYVAGTYNNDTTGQLNSFVLDRSTNSVRGVGDTTFSIAQGINSAGQMVGSVNHNRQSFSQNLITGDISYFSYAGAAQTSARAINDTGLLAGWIASSNAGIRTFVGTPGEYQLLNMPNTAVSSFGEGINNQGQVAGVWSDMPNGVDSISHGFIATLASMPTSSAQGVYTFEAAVTADTPLFIDPTVAVGYVYKVGSGNPLFKTVSLPVGIGDNQFTITVNGQTYTVFGNQIFDFTAHGFANGVSEFTVTGIEADAQVDPNNPTAFLTRLTFASDGNFTGTQTALTTEFTPAVPEPATWAMAAAGLLLIQRRLRQRKA